MVKVSLLYPNSNDVRFDISYYMDKHVPMAIQLLSTHAGYRGVSVARGFSGAMPGSAPSYLVICELLFNSLEEFIAAFMPHAMTLQADLANFTDVQPVIQCSEVLFAQ